ncbi:amino acid/amide ABC transporter substrate-binding protein, HAAT family [Rhizobiales bacterium GAS188]|nr:amino acid/amide ABC transporter substrate-binding protein, HAAT family [Rhizobiales bacterium GAS188]
MTTKIPPSDQNGTAAVGRGLTRRQFTKRAAVTVSGAALAETVPALWRTANAAEIIKVGFLSPRSGPLAGFGEGDPYVIDLVRKTLAKGFAVGGKTYAVELIDKDAQSDPARAGQLAKELITSNAIDFMLTTSTPETVNPVSDACEAAGVPCLSTVMPWEAWYFGRGAKPGAPSPFKWTYHFSFGVKNFLDCYVSQWSTLQTNKKLGVLYPNDADGNAIREHLAPALAQAGYTVIDPGGYEDGTSDYSAQIAKFKAEKCEIFNTFPIPPDFATFWRQAAQQGYTKTTKIVQIAKTGLFPSNVEALGSLGDKLASACYWHRDFPYSSSLTGVTSKDLADGYEKVAGKQWNQQIGASMSLFDAGFAALKNSGAPNDKAAVAKALSTLKTITTVGLVDFTSGPFPNVSPSSIIGTQWVKTKAGSKFKFDLLITENANDSKVPIGAKLLSYN